MTREELRDYVDEQFNNIPYHVYSALIDGIDTLEPEPVLDKIRAEIVHLHDWAFDRDGVLKIIDKYKAETEEEE